MNESVIAEARRLYHCAPYHAKFAEEKATTTIVIVTGDPSDMRPAIKLALDFGIAVHVWCVHSRGLDDLMVTVSTIDMASVIHYNYFSTRPRLNRDHTIAISLGSMDPETCCRMLLKTRRMFYARVSPDGTTMHVEFPHRTAMDAAIDCIATCSGLRVAPVQQTTSTTSKKNRIHARNERNVRNRIHGRNGRKLNTIL